MENIVTAASDLEDERLRQLVDDLRSIGIDSSDVGIPLPAVVVAGDTSVRLSIAYSKIAIKPILSVFWVHLAERQVQSPHCAIWS